LGLENFYWIFFVDVSVGEGLIVIEVDQVSRSIILVVWAAFWTVSGEVSYFSTLEAGVGRVSGGSGIPLKVILGSVSLVPIGVLPSMEVVASIVSSVVSSGRRPISVDVHWDGSVVHPSRGVG